MPVTLTSKRYQVQDAADAIEFCFQQGWTDGLPVVPPTPDRVSAMLEAARLEPSQQVAFITNRAVSVTAEKVAVHAAMAGCQTRQTTPPRCPAQGLVAAPVGQSAPSPSPR